jgi:hypothetical protein
MFADERAGGGGLAAEACGRFAGARLQLDPGLATFGGDLHHHRNVQAIEEEHVWLRSLTG